MCGTGEGLTEAKLFFAASAKGWSYARTRRVWTWLLDERERGRFSVSSAESLVGVLDSLPVDLVSATDLWRDDEDRQEAQAARNQASELAYQRSRQVSAQKT